MLIWYAQQSFADGETLVDVFHEWPLTFISLYWFMLVLVTFGMSFWLENRELSLFVAAKTK